MDGYAMCTHCQHRNRCYVVHRVGVYYVAAHYGELSTQSMRSCGLRSARASTWSARETATTWSCS
eukprot:3764791-Pleurochrysis_carterae.AAC.1